MSRTAILKYSQSIKYGSASQSGYKPNIIVKPELQTRASDGDSLKLREARKVKTSIKVYFSELPQRKTSNKKSGCPNKSSRFLLYQQV